MVTIRRVAASLLPAVVFVALGWSWLGAQAPGVDLRGFWAEPVWMPDATPPPTHDATWLRNHGTAATAGGADCATCHTEASCADCHAAAGAPLAFHGAGYALLHGVDARRGDASCGSCHAEARFCRTCHARSLLDVDAPDRATSRSPHPAGWATRGHAAEARRDLVACTSCHTEASCATCHASVDPHGAGFAARCDALASQAGPTCAGCHVTTPPCPR